MQAMSLETYFEVSIHTRKRSSSLKRGWYFVRQEILFDYIDREDCITKAQEQND